MNNGMNKKFFIGSLLIHLFVIFLLTIITSNNNIHKKFLVFGAHSKKPTHAYFKPLKTVPPNNTTNNIVRKTQTNRRTVSKPVQKRQPVQKKQIPIKKQPPKVVVKKAPPPKPQVVKPVAKPIQVKAQVKPEVKTVAAPFETPPKAAPPAFAKASADTQGERKQKEKPKEVVQKPEEKLEEELHFNLMGESDPNLAIFQKQIQTEVQRLWKPPVGVPKGTECTLSFAVSSDGNIKSFETIKRSKVLIYDLSVTRIAKNFKFDKCLWGKIFTIDFRQ